MYAFSELQRNKITISQLLTAYNGERGVLEQIKKFFPTELNARIFKFEGLTNIANVRNGSAYRRFEECAEAFKDEHAAEILSHWKDRWTEIKAFDGSDRTREITREECARRILNGGERELLAENCPELLNRLDDALALNDGEYLQRIFAVLTILAVTRDPTGKRWRTIADKLLAIENFLPSIPSHDDEERSSAQEDSLADCKNFFEQGNFDSAKKSLNAALEDDTPIWNSFVWREWAHLQQKPAAQLEAYINARTCLENALRGNSTNSELRKNWRETSEEFLSAAIKFLERGDDTLAREFEKPLPAEKFFLTWYGEASFRFAEFYQTRDEKIFLAWLKRGVELNDHKSLNLLMYLCPLEGAEIIPPVTSEKLNADYGRKLAETLKNSPLKQISGSAHWRLYLLTKDERHLQAAYEADFPAAIREHNQGVVSYVEDLRHAISSESGHCLLNVTPNHHLAKIFLKTVPENWSIAAQENFSAEMENLPAARFVCLLIDDDARKNLSDFLTLLANMKKNPSPNSTVFIRGENDLLTPIVDTALKQYYYEKNPPILRVEILDDELNAVRKLFAQRPLFLPLLKKNLDAPTTLRFVTIGESRMCSLAAREAEWFMTFPDELKIAKKITPLETFDEKNFAEFLEPLITENEALYFLVDVGDDLQNLSLAIKIRELLTRAWLKFSKDETPPFAPIAFRCENIDFAFMSRRLIVLGEEESKGVFNNHFLTPVGLRYTWSELVDNIYSRLAVAVHMVYCGVPADKTFADEEYRKAFVGFSRRTYNRRSSLAVAQSLLTRTFVISRLLGIKIFDETFINTENLFDEPTRKKILSASPLFTALKEFYFVLKTARKKASELRNTIELYEILDDSQELDKILDELLAQKEIPPLELLKKFRDFKESYEVNYLDAADVKKLSKKLAALREKILNPRIDDIEKTFIWEHDRWSAYMRYSEGWLAVKTEDAIRYINAGNNNHQQNFLAKLHPCIDLPWCHLKTLSENLYSALGKEKDFKGSDIQSILATAELLVGE